MDKKELINYLDTYLKIWEYKDESKNWLQVDTEQTDIKSVWFAVDATTYIYEKAIENNIEILFVHHGMFWWIESTITETFYHKVAKLITNNIWLYACHLPLDAHNEVWNNIWLIKLFTKIFEIDKYELRPFGKHHSQNIWYAIRFDKLIKTSSIIEIFVKQLELEDKLFNFANHEYINSIAIVSWWWWFAIQQAKDKNYDLLITWEAAHHEIVFTKELWQSILLWWHQETEKYWVQLLAKHITDKFGITTMFLDEKY